MEGMHMKALLLIDIQNGFCPGGNLAVPEGDQIVPIANSLIDSSTSGWTGTRPAMAASLLPTPVKILSTWACSRANRR
jgi:hypothetical protein